MPHLTLPEGFLGITAGFAFRPDTAKPMRELAHILLHEPSSLAPGERELIATYVSSQNDCYFCQSSHGAAAACHLGSSDIVKQVTTDFESAPVSPKLKALLAIAGKVQQSGRNVTSSDIDHARPLLEAADAQQMASPMFGPLDMAEHDGRGGAEADLISRPPYCCDDYSEA